MQQKNETSLFRRKNIFIGLIIIIFILLSSTIYFYIEYKKAADSNNTTYSQLEYIVLDNISLGEESVELLMKNIGENDFINSEIVPHRAYSSLTLAKEAVKVLRGKSFREAEEMRVLMSLHFTLDSLLSFLSQIDAYYGYRNQQPFDLKNCAAGSIENQEDIYHELNNFLNILHYSDKEIPEWSDLLSSWEAANGYDCDYQ